MRKLVLAVAGCLSLLSIARADDGSMQMKHDDMQGAGMQQDGGGSMKHDGMQGGMKHEDGMKPSMAKAGKKKHHADAKAKGMGMDDKGDAMGNGGKM